MAEFLDGQTKLDLIFPAKEPSIYNEIHTVKKRTFVYPGERVLLALSLQYIGTERSIESRKLWRNSARKLRVSSSTIVCFRKDVAANDTRTLGAVERSNTAYIMKNSSRDQMDRHFKSCHPFASYSNGVSNKRVDLTNPIPIQDDEVLLPLVVTVNTQEPEADSTVVTVSVSSQPNLAPKAREGFLDLFLKLPMDEVFEMHSDRWKASVQAEIAVVPPPEVKCRHVATGGKHFLIITVSNHYSEDLHISDLQVLVNKNEGLILPGHRSTTSNESTGLECSNIELILCKSSQLPVVLQPFEQHTFVFQLHINQEMWRNNALLTLDVWPIPNKYPGEWKHRHPIHIVVCMGIHIPLFLSLSWYASSMGDGQSTCTQFALPTIRLDFPSFVMSAHCNSPVTVGESFHVTYTLLNNLQDFLGITLLWMPGNAPVAESDENSLRFIEEAVVCQQPTNQLGFCAKGSTATVTVAFQALRPGLHELGKYMKLKLQYTQPPNSTKGTQKQDKPQEKKEQPKIRKAKAQQLPRHLSLNSAAPPPAMSPSLPRRSQSFTGADAVAAGYKQEDKQVMQWADTTEKENSHGSTPGRHTALPRSSSSPAVRFRQENNNSSIQTVSVDRIAKKKCQILVLEG